MPTPKDILKQYWGFDSFRPMQEDIIQSVLDGKDTLALLPTGGGKSICFQIPALVKEGICIVVSPLIALMKDQVYNLQKRNISAVAIYSGMHYRDIDRVLDNCIHGNIKFLYLSPERLITDLAIARIQQMNVNLIAVDEAHCISQWGYDFRPPYLQIAETRELHPKIPILALTATATKDVVNDIQEKLEFKTENVFQQSFKRDNLSYVVLYEEDKFRKLHDVLKNVKGSGVVYTRNRRKTKEIALSLHRQGIHADFYHAGLNAELRSKKQEAWINNQTRIMVCTNAFGMGIDKPDVRTVVHMDVPDNLEAYFQEAGRGGRDGKKSYAVLLYNEMDKKKLLLQTEQAFPDIRELKTVYRALGSYFQLAVGGGAGDSFDFEISDFVEKYKLKMITTYNALKILQQEGWINITDSVFMPSSVKIIVGKDKLYDYQLKNRKHDRILKVILRSFQGAFLDYTRINETWMAKKLEMPRHKVQEALHRMHQAGIILFRVEKDKPQLMFLQERVGAENLTIDLELYNFRKKRYLERIQKVIHYNEAIQCRSQLLLSYFGEEESETCGVCDVCLGRNKVEISTDEFARFQSKILLLLKENAMTVGELLESFNSKRHGKLLKALEMLIDEGQIDKEGDKLVIQP